MFVDSMYQLGSKRSCIRELFEYGQQKARELGPEHVFDYSLGNPSVPVPAEAGKVIEELVETEDTLVLHGYTSASGSLDTRAAVADDLNARYHAGVRPENLFMTCGAAPALVSILRALAIPGAEILLLTPFFPEYVPFSEANGAKPVIVPAEEGFRLNAQSVERYVTPHTQAIIVNSPNNPSGVVYTREELEALAEMLRRKEAEYGHPIYIVADEPYRELVYDGVEVPFIPTIYADTLVCYSWSKSLSMPGERIGYVLVPDAAADSHELLCAIAGAARAHGHVCAPSLIQRVIAHCAHMRPDVAAYDRNRKTLYEALTSYGYSCVNPSGAFYMLVRAPGGNSQAFSDRAKLEENLLIVPGEGFGCPEYFRLSTCVSHDMILRSLPSFQRLIQST